MSDIDAELRRTVERATIDFDRARCLDIVYHIGADAVLGSIEEDEIELGVIAELSSDERDKYYSDFPFINLPADSPPNYSEQYDDAKHEFERRAREVFGTLLGTYRLDSVEPGSIWLKTLEKDTDAMMGKTSLRVLRITVFDNKIDFVNEDRLGKVTYDNPVEYDDKASLLEAARRLETVTKQLDAETD